MLHRKCRGCGSQLFSEDVLCDLGAQPLANGLLTDLSEPEVHYPLRPLVCRECLLVQLPEQHADAFTDEYPFYAGQSAGWQKHCDEFVTYMEARSRSLPYRPYVLDIGSNDGTMLAAFRNRGVKATFGVDPCREVAMHAIRNGIATHVAFWSEKHAKSLFHDSDHVDLLIATNVLAHVPDLNDFLRGVAVAIGHKGEAVFEVPYVGNMLRDCQFDQIYAEHHSYFSLHSLGRALGEAGLLVYDVTEVSTHGGSLRVHAMRVPCQEFLRPSVIELQQREIAWGLDKLKTYTDFYPRPAGVKINLLGKLTANTGSTWGYGASAKAITLMNYCGIDRALIQAVVDTTPAKQGKFTPGSRIPIVAPEALAERQPAHVVNFLWNWREEAERNIRALCPDTHIINPFAGWTWTASKDTVAATGGAK